MSRRDLLLICHALFGVYPTLRKVLFACIYSYLSRFSLPWPHHRHLRTTGHSRLYPRSNVPHLERNHETKAYGERRCMASLDWATRDRIVIIKSKAWSEFSSVNPRLLVFPCHANVSGVSGNGFASTGEQHLRRARPQSRTFPDCSPTFRLEFWQEIGASEAARPFLSIHLGPSDVPPRVTTIRTFLQTTFCLAICLSIVCLCGSIVGGRCWQRTFRRGGGGGGIVGPLSREKRQQRSELVAVALLCQSLDHPPVFQLLYIREGLSRRYAGMAKPLVCLGRVGVPSDASLILAHWQLK